MNPIQFMSWTFWVMPWSAFWLTLGYSGSIAASLFCTVPVMGMWVFAGVVNLLDNRIGIPVLRLSAYLGTWQEPAKLPKPEKPRLVNGLVKCEHCGGRGVVQAEWFAGSPRLPQPPTPAPSSEKLPQ